MKIEDLDKVMGINLAKLRTERRLTQEQLAERILVNPKLVHKWERGTKGIGKKVLINLCDVFKVRPYVFYVDEKSPFIRNSREREILCKVREAEKLGVADMIEQFGSFVVGHAKKMQNGGKGRPKSVETAGNGRRGGLPL